MAVCGSCKKEVADHWQFCRYCGTAVVHKIDLDDLAAADIFKSSRKFMSSEPFVDDVLAVSVDLEKLPSFVDNHLEIKPEQIALMRGTHPGWIYLGQESRRLELDQANYLNHLVVLSTVSRTLAFTIENLFSQDPIPAIVECDFEVQITSPEELATALEVEPRVFTTADLQNMLLPDMESSASQFFYNVAFSELAYDAALAAELSEQLRLAMTPMLRRYGISISGGIATNVYQEIWLEGSDDPVRDLVSSTDEMSAGRSQRPHSMSASSFLALTEETSLALPTRKKSAILKTIRLSVLSRSYFSSDGKDRLEALVGSLDPEGLITPDRVDTIFHSVGDFVGDTEKSTALLVKRLDLEIEYEEVMLSLIRRYGLSDERLLLEVQKARNEFESIWQIERSRMALEVDHYRERLEAGHIDAPTSAEIPQAPVTTDLVERGLEWYARYKEIKREDRTAQAYSEIEIQHRQDMLKLEKEAASVEINLRQVEVEHRRRLEEIEALSKVSIETLIAVSGPEQGNLLLQLSKTRALQGFTSEKILALQGIGSPLVQDAVREIGTALVINGSQSDLLSAIGGSDYPHKEAGPETVAALTKNIADSLEAVRNNPLVSGAQGGSERGAAALLGPTLSDHETMTILFSDIKGSTEITDRLGDMAAQELFNNHNNIVRAQVSEYQGHEIKSMGDGFMLAFPSALNGILCAIHIQKMLLEYNNSLQKEPIMVRIGLHAGEVIRENQDYFGRNVILASRISSQAKENQILVSSILKEMTDSFNQLEFDTPMSVALKGLPGDVLVYPVNW